MDRPSGRAPEELRRVGFERRHAKHATRIEVREATAEAFDRELRAALKDTVWHTGCTSWYVDENGNDPNQWPWLWSNYRKRTASLAPGAYELSAAERAPVAS